MSKKEFRKIFGFMPVKNGKEEEEKVRATLGSLARSLQAARQAFSGSMRAGSGNSGVTGPARDQARSTFNNAVWVARQAGFKVPEDAESYS